MLRACKGALCVLLALLLFLPFGSCSARESEQILRVTVLDVGQSDCILLSQGDVHALIDTGTSASRESIVAELASRGVRSLAFVIVTHPHEDHFGNARYIMETRTVGELILSDIPSDDIGYRLLTDTADACGVPVRAWQEPCSLTLGTARLDLLCALPDDANINNASLVVRVHFGETVLLFMGDAEEKAEAALLASGVALDCDFLKVGHHGSDTATSKAFLEATTPTLAAISCGWQNEHGFPHAAVLDRLAASQTAIYRTDLSGTLQFVSDGKAVTFLE